MNLLWLTGSGKDASRAKAFVKEIEKGRIMGILSTWTLMEIISSLRAIHARMGQFNTGIIDQEVEEALAKILKIKNVCIVSGTPMQMSAWSLGPPMLWEVLEPSLEELHDTYYEVKENKKGRRYIEGIGSNDALHIYIAVAFGCDYLATFDNDFWNDDRPIKIFDVRNNTER
jgi:predicted nucleic acid-binding protein